MLLHRIAILAALAGALPAPATEIDSIFNVRLYGANGDRESDQTTAIQAALDAAGQAGGGRVHLPPGDYLTGPLHLRSNVTLHLEAGATLWATPEEGRYYAGGTAPDLQAASQWKGLHPDLQLINGHGLENVTISGRGRIHGQGSDYWWNKRRIRPYVIRLEDCRNVVFEGVTTVESMFHTFNFTRVEGLVIRDVSLFNDPKSPNTDGFHLMGCRFVHIAGVNMDTGDDCIVVGGDTTDLTVTGCRFSTPWGVLWVTGGRRITMTGCTVTCQMLIKDLRRAEDVMVSGIIANGPGKLFTMMGGPVKSLLVSDVIAHDWSQCGWLEDAEDVVLDNVRIMRRPGGGSPVLRDGFEFRRVRNLTLRNVSIENIDSGPSIEADDVTGFELDGVNIRNTPVDAPLIALNQAEDVSIRNVRAASPPTTWLTVSGDRSRDVSFGNVRLPGAAVAVSTTVPAGALASVAAEFSGLDVPDRIEAHRAFAVRATAKNTSPEAGLCAMPAVINGRTAATRWLWLQAGESLEAAVTAPPLYEDRDYAITIGSLPPVNRRIVTVPARLVCESLEVSPEITSTGNPLRGTASIRNAGSTGIRDSVEVGIDGAVVARRAVDLEPGEAATLAFEMPAPAAGLHAVTLLDAKPAHFKTYERPLDSAVVHYRFDAVAGGAVRDDSGLGHDLRLEANPGGRLPWLESGVAGKALAFDGRTSFAVIDRNLLRFPMTLSLWMKPGTLNETSTAGRQMVVYAGIPKGNDGYGPEPETHLMRATGNQLVWWSNNGSRIYLAASLPPEGEFFHVAVVHDETSRLYIDGTEVAAFSGNQPPDYDIYADRIYLGRPTVDYLRYFAGAIDELIIFNEPLGLADIESLARK